jgi:translocator protein
MIMLIFFTIFRFSEISKTAAWLLVPYISWVFFATILNYKLWILNG